MENKIAIIDEPNNKASEMLRILEEQGYSVCYREANFETEIEMPYYAKELIEGESVYMLPPSNIKPQSKLNQRKRRKLARQSPHGKYNR